MSREIMQQALAKFESLWEIGIDAVYKVELLPEIRALRQAIEQAEKQEPVAWMVRDSIDGSWYPCAFENPAGAIKGESKPLYAVPQQAEKQEPIAWMVYTLDGASAFVTDNPNDFTELHSCFALYTAPPRKEWVGLTEDEMSEIYNKNYDLYDTDMTYMDFFIVQRDVEAKLKGKNGG
jgi:hypothetical protein